MEQKDHVFIDALEDACRIGTTPAERAFPQPVFVSIRAYLPLKKAGTMDNLEESIDYAVVASAIRSLLGRQEFNLVEAVAEKAAQAVLTFPHVDEVWIRVEKKVLPGIRSVGAEIWRKRNAG